MKPRRRDCRGYRRDKTPARVVHGLVAGRSASPTGAIEALEPLVDCFKYQPVRQSPAEECATVFRVEPSRCRKPGQTAIAPGSSARATLPCALRRFNVSLNLPGLAGAAGSGCTRLPLSFFFLLFLLLVVMRLDGQEHGRAQHEQLECNEDYRNPIHDFLDTLHQQLGQWFKPSWIRHGSTTILFVAAATVPKRSPGSQTQIRPKNSGSDDGHGDFAREILVKVQWRSIRFPCISVAHDDEAP